MKESIPAISKEALNTLPVEVYEGPLEVVDTIEGFECMMELLNLEKIIGFDTETKPVFAKGKRNKVALLQLATPDSCFLVRLNKIGFPDELFKLFANEHILKIGLSIKDDFLMLRGRNGDLEPKSFIELQSFVKDYGIADNSLQKIYAILFGKKLSKAQRLSNWEADILSPGQKTYAALDAVACLRIYLELEKHYQFKSLETDL
jgi:ribonuclease D